MRQKVISVLLGLVAAAAMVLGFSTATATAVPTGSGSVHATQVCTKAQGSDIACLSGSTITVCDREADGHGVYADVITHTGRVKVGDTNGSTPPCHSKSISGITKFRVCETLPGNDACTPFKDA